MNKQTIEFKNKPILKETGCAVGPKESAGPLAIYFDIRSEDAFFKEETFEKAESKFMKSAIDTLLSKAGLQYIDIDYILAGDLLNQCIASGYCIRDLNIPFLGLFGACSTFVEGMILASILVDGNYAKNCINVASSHFCSAERQFRMPLEHGNQKSPTAQCTVTGAGASLISNNSNNSKSIIVTYATPGKIVDLGVKDMSNMGAAMAPAAADTILTHLKDLNRDPEYYDLIITGDLGIHGSNHLLELCLREGFDLTKVHKDCGKEIFDLTERDMNSGGSGCGCIASTFCGYFYSKLKEKNINKILLVATGALMSPISIGQGETIPCIAHAIVIENEV